MRIVIKMIAFGPVPSRRLGRSLGINNIPPKVCSYSCAYCQVGRTTQTEVERRPFYQPEEILKEVKEKLETAANMRKAVDYITFVPDGEPSLDVNLGQEMDLLKPLGIKVAVISNASLIWDEGVRKELSKADWVSLKVDAVDELAWRRINRPHSTLKLDSILGGILDFYRSYKGVLATETMLARDVNDSERSLEMIADFLAQVHPAKAYISVPTRPPAENWVMPPSEESINRAYQIFSRKMERVELLVGYEGDIFDFTGDVERDLLSITAVHPMRKEAVDKFLEQAGKSWDVIQRLIDAGQLVENEYGGNRFYLRRPEIMPP
ncbi:Radical SAM superfamily protein [uncultured archaeon]|nr:Radical SAM superfamily protein [uncultured archaeon]